VNFIESAIKACDGVLMQASGQKSFGISIVLFTLVLKGLTYPLTKAQLTSTTKMQAIQPKVRSPRLIWRCPSPDQPRFPASQLTGDKKKKKKKKKSVAEARHTRVAVHPSTFAILRRFFHNITICILRAYSPAHNAQPRR
jgi:hypothetical protein